MTERTARSSALYLLERIEKEKAFANLALSSYLARSPLDARDRAFCTELVYGTLRMSARLDYILAQLLKRPLAVLPHRIHSLLRLSVYQLEFLKSIPPYAVVNEAVTLAGRSGAGAMSGLVNGVLRGFLRQRSLLSLPNRDDMLGYLTITLSHPRWLAERWLGRWGAERAAAVAEADNAPAEIVLRTNTLRIARDELLAKLSAAGIEAKASALTPEGIRLHRGGAPEELPGFEEGLFFLQDDGAVCIGHLVNPKAGECILDLCAAPGGKTTHLAALSGDQARITALDIHGHKVELIRANCRRLGVTCVRAEVGDGRAFLSDELFDAVLLDTPCSGTGVLRRRADLRWRRKPEDLAELVILQRSLLENAARLLKPGGRLIYSTCSLESEENEEQMAWFLETHPTFRATDVQTYLGGRLPRTGESLRGVYLWPPLFGTDGFFFCRLEKQ